MFDRNSDYALNKKDPDAIVCKSATGIHIRLTRADFSSAEEFEKWKRWSDENYHAIEKADHRHSNRTISLEGLAELSFAVLSAETKVMDQYDQEERARLCRLLAEGLDACLTAPQRRRLWLRYWQASGESIKTSVRTKTRLEQLTESGFYTGGSIAYGYRLDKRGRTNKRNKEVFDLAIDEDAAKIIQLIFQKYVNEGYGAQRLSRYLEEKKIRKPNGKNFPNTSINRIIKNPIYTGVIRNGDAQSAFIPELQIIDQEAFDRAQKIMSDRTTHHAETPLNLKGQSLLVGNIFCGHCKNRLTLTTGGRNRVRKDGSIYHDIRARYQCHYNVRHPGECDGQSGYGVKKLDGIIDRIVRYQLSKISAASGEDIVAKQNQKAIELAKARYHLATVQLAEKQRELVDYQNEGIKVIRGQSKFDMEFLNELVSKAKAEVTELEAAVEAAREELDIHLANADVERKEYEKIKTWADLYDNCNFAAKKMIISQFIKSVYVYRDYTLEIEFNVSFEEFRTMATECQDQGTSEQPLVYITA